jgi:hypothetical protein
MRDLYILILAGLFGNRWNAKCPLYLKFYDHTNGQECILQT